jgi:hypothetical protein
MIMLLFFIMYIYLAHLDHENVLVGRISVNVWLVDHEDVVLVPGKLAAGQLQDVSSLTLHTQIHCFSANCIRIQKKNNTERGVADLE